MREPITIQRESIEGEYIYSILLKSKRTLGNKDLLEVFSKALNHSDTQDKLTGLAQKTSVTIFENV